MPLLTPTPTPGIVLDLRGNTGTVNPPHCNALLTPTPTPTGGEDNEPPELMGFFTPLYDEPLLVEQVASSPLLWGASLAELVRPYVVIIN